MKCGTCNASATNDFHLQYLNIEAKKVCKITQHIFGSFQPNFPTTPWPSAVFLTHFPDIPCQKKQMCSIPFSYAPFRKYTAQFFFQHNLFYAVNEAWFVFLPNFSLTRHSAVAKPKSRHSSLAAVKNGNDFGFTRFLSA
jgi:hypothetical protein